MLNWLINRIYDALEPRLQKLVKDAVAEAVQDISIEVESLPAEIVNNLADKVPGLGFLKGIL